jgi:uncharacterized protein (TIGR03492 family)
MTRRVLLVSNGVGEDLIAASLATALEAAGVTITAYPLVGVGAHPPHVTLLEPRQALPSGGFSLRTGFRDLSADLAAGMIRLWLGQRRTLGRQRGRGDLVVAVGDAYCLWMAAAASPGVAFLATADSVHIAPFGPVARWVLRRHARRIFARDPETAQALAAQGLPAVAAGLVTMDHLPPTGETFGLSPQAPVVALLPGSRRDAVDNAILLARAAAAIAAARRDVGFIMALAPSVPADEVANRLLAVDWSLSPLAGTVVLGDARLHLTSAFADALARASVVIGLAGTANEQAAGLGRPVVAFPGRGAQFGPSFLRMQHRLLGEALVPTRTWQEAAAATVRLLGDAAERERRGAAGRARMGPSGGTQRITQALLEMLEESRPSVTFIGTPAP